MPPIVATFIVFCLVGYLFRRDFRARPNVTAALWLPCLWFFLISTRTFSQWMQAFGFQMGGNTYEEGNPLDAVVFFGIIIAGAMVLHRRHFNMAVFTQNNRWLMAFLIYCLISVVWSDFSFISFKRWIKILGHPIMVLVLLTEPDPEEAIIQMIKRCAYIIFPVSILFIKYYPDLGRTFDPFIGAPSNTGIALDKNMLGSVCMIAGIFLIWYLLKVQQQPPSRERRLELIWTWVVLFFAAWVLYLAHSSTSLVSMLVAIGIILFLGLKSVNPQRLTGYLVVGAVLIAAAQWGFDLYGAILNILGKDSTLTDRTKVWGEVLKIDINPVIGTGFESFWLGERREELWRIYWWHPIQSHNGYLETYLNIGLIGLGFMVMLIVNAYQKGRRMLLSGLNFARFRLGFLGGFVLYNWTEAAFKALHPVWFIFFIVAMDYSEWPSAKVENSGPMVDTGVPAKGADVIIRA
jgi:exopolysaccharide production protein ExoQ